MICGSPSIDADQPTRPPARPSGRTASGAMIIARAAIHRSISPMGPTGMIVSVPTASRSTVDRSNRWNFQIGNSIKNSLAFGDESAHFAPLRLFRKRLQVRAGNKD